LRCAKDHANIVVAAKTTEPHPKLPGTIYTAAEESKLVVGNSSSFDSTFFIQLKKLVENVYPVLLMFAMKNK
jgi:hypothetical protein